MQAVCPQCDKHIELILTPHEEREARETGWYVSCPVCRAVFVHHEGEASDAKLPTEFPKLDR